MPRPHRVGALSVDDRRLSVRLSVCPCLTLSREWKGATSWKPTGRKPITWTIWDLTYNKSKGQRSRSLWVVQVTTCRGRGHYGGRTTGRTACLIWNAKWPKMKRCYFVRYIIRTCTTFIDKLQSCSRNTQQKASIVTSGKITIRQ